MTSAHPADSAIVGHLWTTPEASALFSDAGRTQAWLQILAALAQAQADAGLIPTGAAAAIRAHADVALLDLDLVAEQTRRTGHSTMGLITALRAVLPEQAREWVYYGATVQDLSDTWFALVSRAVGDIAERDVTRMRDRALALAGQYRDTPMCGRTHGQPGLPVTFGFKANAGLPTNAGLPATTPTFEGELATVTPSSVAPDEPWYLIQARADADGDGTACMVAAASWSPDVVSVNDGE